MAELNFKTEMEFAYGEPRELVPGVVRIVANNPSPFTFKGTNTYLVGTDELALIDPGPRDEAHLAAVLRAAAGRPITHIVLTHTHHDHFDGLADLARAVPDAKICGYGRAARSGTGTRLAADGTETSDVDFVPGIALRDGDVITGKGWRLEALHTPGHAPDHLCFELGGTGVLFSADHVMAWSTSVVAPPEGRMADYMTSLERLMGRSADKIYLPGHGGQLAEPQRVARAYLLHRRWREEAILGAIRDGHHAVADIVGVIYRGLDERLVRAATLSVLAHVEHLIERKRAVCDGPPNSESLIYAA
ncbi:MAG: MBL fold metallo-hydrolase [Hyphomicrobiaceae bacterium]